MVRIIQSHEKQRPTAKIVLLAKVSFRIEEQADKELARKEKKVKEFIITKPLLYEMLKGLI